jgi:YD repeat-containing protein
MQARTYDDSARLTSYTDWRGNQTRLSYNNRGLVQTRVEGVGEQGEKSITTDWHTEFNLPVRIDGPGYIREYTYDPMGRLLTHAITDCDNR